MKNTLQSNIWSGLLAAVITGGLILSAAPAFAADVILSGDVAAITTVEFGATAGLGSTLGTAGLSAFTVATATEKNNVTAGYTVTLSSASASAAASGSRNVSTLRLTGALTTTPITYTMTYGGVAVALGATTGALVITRGTTVNTPAGLDRVLAITTSAATSAHAGTYTDTVTVTVAAL